MHMQHVISMGVLVRVDVRVLMILKKGVACNRLSLSVL